MSTALTIATAQKKANPTIADHLKAYEPEFQRALGQSMDAAKFAQDALTAIKASPAIGNADARSLFGALFLAAQLKLPVGGPLAQFHLTVRKVKGQPTVVPIVGYGGYIQLMMNTGLYSKVGAFLVHERDHFKKGANSERAEWFDFEEAVGDRGPVLGVIAYAKLKGFDESQWRWVDAETIRRKHRPQYWQKTPWESDEPDMFLKTGIRVLQKWVPKTAEQVQVALAAASDQAVVRKVDGVPELQVQYDDPAPLAAVEAPAEDDWQAREKAEADAYLAAKGQDQ